MKNFLMKTFQGKIDSKKEIKPQNNSKENNLKTTQIKKVEPAKIVKDIKIKPKAKISQEIMNTNIALLGQYPINQNLNKEINKTNKDIKKDEKLNAKNLKETKINKNKDKNDNNDNNKKYKEPYKPLAHYIIDKNLRFEENKSKPKEEIKNKSQNKNIKSTSINLGNNTKKNTSNDNNEFNSDEEDELIKSKRQKINLALNQSKKNNKIQKEKEIMKKVIKSLINDEPEKDSDKEKQIEQNKKGIKKSVSGNFVRLNLKKKYQEKKRFRPVKLRKIALNHSKELYKYQKKTIKNSSSNYMGKGNQGLEDMDTLMKEQNDADKNDNSNLLNTLVEKLPVFSQSFIEETQKTPNKTEDNNDNSNKDENNK